MISSVLQEDVGRVVERVGVHFKRLSGKNILLTGGTGFVGSHLLETIAHLNDKILAKPCRVFVTTRDPEGFSRRRTHLVCRKDITLLRGDVRTFRASTDAWDFIIHAASPADPLILAKNPREAMDVIVEGTKRVLTLASRKRVERFLFLSSGAVYGPQPARLKAIPETYCGGPDLRSDQAGYGEAKRYAEVLCRAYQGRTKVPVLVARLFAFIGPYMDLNSGFASMDFLRHALQGKPIRIHGDGRAIRTLCYSADMAVAMWKILLCAPGGEVYNVGTDQGAVSIKDLARKVAGAVGPPAEVRIERGGRRDGIRPRYVPDITKLRADLEFSIAYDLDTALARTVKHLLEESRPWKRQLPSPRGVLQ